MTTQFTAGYLERQTVLLNRAMQTPYVACIDLEATCTDDPLVKPTYFNEIIEIGWALLDTQSLTVVETRQIFVHPTTTTILPFCTQLTGITAERVADAPALAGALGELASAVVRPGEQPVMLWGSFGEYDRKQFERQCEAEAVANPMAGVQHMNVKAAAQIALKTKRGLGLNKAVQQLGLSFYGSHHSGVDDAVNVANVLAAVIRLRRAG